MGGRSTSGGIFINCPQLHVCVEDVKASDAAFWSGDAMALRRARRNLTAGIKGQSHLCSENQQA